MSSSPRARAVRKPKQQLALHRLLPTFFRPGAMDLVLFSRQLAVFLRAGVPLVPAVEALAEQSSNPLLRDTLYLVRGASARRRLIAALLYPVLVILVALVMVVVMVVFVLPSMAGLFREFGTELPLPTQIVLAVAAFARDYGIASVVGGIVLAIGAFLFSRTRPGARFFD